MTDTKPTRSTTRRTNGEGSQPVLRSDGRYASQYRVPGTTKRVTVYGKTKKEVITKITELRRREAGGLPPVDAKTTVGAFASAWSAGFALTDASDSTKINYEIVVRLHILGTPLSHMALGAVRPMHIDAWLSDLEKKGLSPSSRLLCFIGAGKVFAEAVRNELIGRDPMDKVKAPRNPRTEAAHLTNTAAREFTAASRRVLDPTSAAFFEVLLLTGMRKGEALGLTWTDVNLATSTIYVRRGMKRRNKVVALGSLKSTASKRAIGIAAPLAEVLREVRRLQTEARLLAGSAWSNPDDLVFTTGLGATLPETTLTTRFNRARDAAGLPATVHTHTLRHTFASSLLTAGVPLLTVSRILGHASVSITADLYGHVSPEVAMDAMERAAGNLAR